MERTALKNYAPKARREFIQAVTDRAGFYGLSAKKVEPFTEKGDVAIIGGRAFPRSIVSQRRALEDRIARQGFDQVMEAMAYTWFNRFVALRYMELHGYLDHGYRVLSHPEAKTIPEIIEHAEHLDLPGLDKNKVIELKLDGAREAELYRLLLVAQCNALHDAMPFLFERIDDETELLLPDNLLHSDSVIRKLVNEIEEEDWKEVEIIGWIYQFYISEKKDQVIGKVVKSEDIPAATQLFTPNWIVKYLVQNTLGRQWLATYPNSPLRQQMEYYIEPAEQTEEVKAQLKAITPESLNPEELTLLDPACGSGHILVEAYDLFKAIYQERGYRSRDIPRIILQKNLYGLEIDDRAAQLAAFALLMKARADDRSIFADHIQPNVLAIQESKGLEKLLRPEVADLTTTGEPLVVDHDLFPDTKKQLLLKKQPRENPLASIEPCLRELIKLFEHGKTFGSLIRVQPELAAQLPAARQAIDGMIAGDQLWEHRAATLLLPLVRQASLLANFYDVVVTNPPYIGSKFHVPMLKKFLKDYYAGYERDLFSTFIDRGLGLGKSHGRVGLMSPFVWMFISSYDHLRVRLIDKETITSLIQLEYSGFEGATVPICTFTLQKGHVNGQRGCYVRLSDFRGSDNQGPKTLEAIENRNCGWFFEGAQDEFKKIPGSPLAFWVSKNEIELFQSSNLLADVCACKKGLDTGNNARFLRLWHEVAFDHFSERNGAKWFPYNKGGDYRRWYGNREYAVDWERDGAAIHRYNDVPMSYNGAPVRAKRFYFREGYTWTTVSSGGFSARYCPKGAIFDNGGCTLFCDSNIHTYGAFLNSAVASRYLEFISPTLNFQPVILAACQSSRLL